MRRALPLAALLAAAACSSAGGSAAKMRPAPSPSPSPSPTASTATRAQYAGAIAAYVSADFRSGYAQWQSACEPISDSAACGLETFGVYEVLQTGQLKIGTLPSDVGAPPADLASEYHTTVRDLNLAVTAAKQASNACSPSKGCPLATQLPLGADLDTLNTDFAVWSRE